MVLICRTEKPLDRDVRPEVSMLQRFGEGRDRSARRQHTIYEYPLYAAHRGTGSMVCDL